MQAIRGQGFSTLGSSGLERIANSQSQRFLSFYASFTLRQAKSWYTKLTHMVLEMRTPLIVTEVQS